MNTYKGRFSPRNPAKYKGDPTNIIYRSLWEKRVMNYLDSNSNVIEWSSEEIIIPYYDKATGRNRRYFPDFLVVAKGPNNTRKTMLLEVKPEAQTKEPKYQKQKTKRYITEVTTWATNKSKWEAATEYCADRGWEFRLITEKELGIK